MQVSYSKPTVNDRRNGSAATAVAARRRWIGRCHVAVHGRKLRISAAGKILYFMTRV